MHNFRPRVRELAETLSWYALFTLIYVVAFRESLLSPATYTAYDITLPPPHPFPTIGAILNSLFESWSPNALGYPILNVNPLIYFDAFKMSFSFNKQLIAEKVLGLSTFVAFFTMDFLLRNHVTKSRTARFAGALLYSLNPLTIKLSPPLWGYALFPLAVNYFLKVALNKEVKVRDSLLLAFLAALTVATYFYYISFLLIVGVVYLAVSAILFRNLSRLLTRLLFILVSLATFLLLMFPYIWTYYEWYFVNYTIPTVQTVQYWYSGWSPFTALMLFASQGPNVVLPPNVALAGILLNLFCALPLFFAGRLKVIKNRINVYSLFVVVTFVVFFGLLASSPTPLFLTLYSYLGFALAPLTSPPGAMLLISFSYACLLAISMDFLIPKGKVSTITRLISGESSRRKAWAILLLTITFVPYFTSYPILNAPAMIYPNPSSMTSIYDFLQQHSDNGSFRYYILPLDTQTEENAYSFPNLFAAQEPALPPSLEYGRFMDYIIVNNLTNHLGSLLSDGNVKYIFVDKVQQHWLQSDQASFSGRYGVPRILGYSWGVWGDWRGFSQVLSKQTDLKLIANETDYAVYENTAFVPKVHVYGSMTLVVGDMRALLPMVSQLGFNTSTDLITYADQNTDGVLPILLNYSSTVVFYDSTINDLLLDILVHQFGIALNNLDGSGWTIGRTYLPLENPLFYSFFGFTGNDSYIDMGNNSFIKILFNANQNGDYQVWIRPFFSPSAGQLKFSAYGETYTLPLTSSGDLGFKWVKLATLQLTKGGHTFEIGNEGNPSYLDRIAIVPSEIVNQTLGSILDTLSDKRTIIILDQASNEFNIQAVKNSTKQIVIQSLNGWSAFPNQTISLPSANTITVNGTLDRICGSCVGGQIVAHYTLPVAENWDQYDYLAFSVKPTEPTLYVALWNASGALVTDQKFTVTTNAWNLVYVPLSNASYADIKMVDFAGVGSEQGSLGRLTISNISLGTQRFVLSLPNSLKAFLTLRNTYSFYFATASGVAAAKVPVEIGGHQFVVTSIGNSLFGPISLDLSLENLPLSFSNANRPVLIVASNRNISTLAVSQESVKYHVKDVTDPTTTLKYIVTTNSSRPVFFYLGESYYPDWQASVGGDTLAHFVAYGFANGYIVNASGAVRVDLSNELQATRNLLVLSSLISFVGIAASLAYDFAKPLRKRFS